MNFVDVLKLESLYGRRCEVLCHMQSPFNKLFFLLMSTSDGLKAVSSDGLKKVS